MAAVSQKNIENILQKFTRAINLNLLLKWLLGSNLSQVYFSYPPFSIRFLWSDHLPDPRPTETFNIVENSRNQIP